MDETEPPLVEGYRRTDFSLLASFPFTLPARRADGTYDLAAVEAQIPARIRRWHDRKVAVTGYMLPLKSEGGLVTEFLLMRFTVAAMNTNEPALNEWALVKIRPGLPAQTRRPMTLLGVLKVGPVFESGYLTAIYELAAERVAAEYLIHVWPKIPFDGRVALATFGGR